MLPLVFSRTIIETTVFNDSPVPRSVPDSHSCVVSVDEPPALGGGPSAVCPSTPAYAAYAQDERGFLSGAG